MSLRRRSRMNYEIDLKAVVSFLHVIWCMAAGITVLTLLGMVLSAHLKGQLIIYQMTLIVNMILLVGGGAAVRWLRLKSIKLAKKSEDNVTGI